MYPVAWCEVFSLLSLLYFVARICQTQSYRSWSVSVCVILLLRIKLGRLELLKSDYSTCVLFVLNPGLALHCRARCFICLGLQAARVKTSC